MDPIAKEMNESLQKSSDFFYGFLSTFGKNIFMPKGIIVQSAEAKQQAKKYNATIGIAKEGADPMVLPSIKKYFNNLKPAEIVDYAPGFGNQELRTKWKKKIIEQNMISDEGLISTPVVTAGLTNGIALIGDLFVEKDDIIVIPDKLWENYNLIYETRYNAKIEYFKLFDDNLKGFNTKSLDETLSKIKKDKFILLLNFPNNPTGYTPTALEVDEIVKIIKKHADNGKKILVVCDDAYFGLLFEDKLLKGSIFGKVAGIHKNIGAIKIDGVSKEDYAWGFRIGFITFADFQHNADTYKILESKTAACIRCSISNCSQPVQSILAAMTGDETYNKEKLERYEILKKRAVKTHSVVYNKKYADFWDVYPFNSGYFMCIKPRGVNAETLRQHLLKNYQIGTIVLGEDLRVAFSSVDLEDIENLFECISQAIKDLKK